MRDLAIRAAIGISLSSMCMQSPALGQATRPGSATVWSADFEDSSCTITTGSTESLGLSFWMTPGDPEPTLYVVGSPKVLPNFKGKTTVELGPSGQTFDADVYPVVRGEARVLHFAQLRHKFPAAFAGSNEIRLIKGNQRVPIPIKGASAAFRELQKCVDETLPEWGIDPVAFAALRQPPTEIEGKSWISGDDYPTDAHRADWQGYVVVRLNVDATGDVTNCAVIVSSGLKSVDKVTCGQAMAWAKFHPAIGPDGQPTPAVRTSNVVFRLEG